MRKNSVAIAVMAGMFLFGAATAKAVVTTGDVTGNADVNSVINSGSTSATSSGVINGNTSGLSNQTANTSGSVAIDLGSGVYQNGSGTGTFALDAFNSLKSDPNFKGTGSMVIDLATGTFKNDTNGSSGKLSPASLDVLRRLLGQGQSAQQGSSQNSQTQSSGTTTYQTSSDTNAGSQNGQTQFIILRSDLSGDGFATYNDGSTTVGTNSSSSTEVTRPADVDSQNDLKSYSMYLLQNDGNIEKIEVNDDGMDLSYRQPGKFLGFIPTKILANVHVAEDGEATIDYPWYTFMTKKPSRKMIRPVVQAKVDTILSAIKKGSLKDESAEIGNGNAVMTGDIASNNTVNMGDTDADTNVLSTVSPQAKAQMLSDIQSIMHANSTGSGAIL